MKKHIGYIENGINLDHIPHGNAWYVMKVLNLNNSDTQTGIGLNLPSNRLGRKDLVKIENRTLTQSEIDAISLFCVGATLSVIEDFKVIQKMVLTLPDTVEDIIICPNERCVSKDYKSKFRGFVDRANNICVKCNYCEQEFLLNNIKDYKI